MLLPLSRADATAVPFFWSVQVMRELRERIPLVGGELRVATRREDNGLRLFVDVRGHGAGEGARGGEEDIERAYRAGGVMAREGGEGGTGDNQA